MQKIIIFVALSFVLISCNNQAKNIENKEVAKDTSEYDILKTYFKKNNFANFEKIKKIIILNNNGCTSCVSIGIDHIINEYKNYGDSVAVIAVFSQKVLPERIILLKSYYKNILIDNSGDFNNYNIAPFESAVIFKNGRNLKIYDIVDYYNNIIQNGTKK
jgi:hypothetical protein